MGFLPSKTQLANWCIDGTWSLGLATLITDAVSPLTFLVAGGIFSVQTAGNFPVAHFCCYMATKITEKDFFNRIMDRDYQDATPILSPDKINKRFEEEMKVAKQHCKAEISKYYQAMGGCKRHEKSLNDELEALTKNLAMTKCTTIEPIKSFLNKLPIISYFFPEKEKEVERQLTPTIQEEIDKIPYGTLRPLDKRRVRNSFKPTN